jgi:peptidyl-prolyl cis-trans isomerase D
MMQLIRTNAGKVMTIVLFGGFLAWMVFGIGMEVTGAGQPRELGSVNGTPITVQEYQAAVEQLSQQARQATGGRVSAEQQAQIEERAWQELVDNALMRQEMERRGIRVSDREISYYALNVPHPELRQQEIFQTEGQFDLAKYQQFLRGPQANDEVLGQLEAYYRENVPRRKLFQQIGAGLLVSDAELWREYQDQNETATVEYVALDLSRVAPGTVQVTPAEIRRYFDAHPREFERARSARFTVAYLSSAVTEADRAATLQKTQRLRAEIAGGADFAAVARRESSDPSSRDNGGDLGWMRKGRTVPAFDSAAFSLPVGELSQPVRSEFGYHLIQVQERPEGADSAKIRHILIPEGKSEAELAKLDARADSLEDLASRNGIDRAARAVGATLRQGVTVSEEMPVIPGVGPALEALNWARGEVSDPEAGPHPVSDVFATDQAVYVVRLEGYQPKGSLSLAEATPQIRAKLVLEKKREQAAAAGRQILAAVRGGKTLQQAADDKGLTVQQAGPFTRVAPNPVFGQANAAIGAAFGTPVGQISQPVTTTSGVFLIRPTARTQADRRAFDAQKAQLRQVSTYQRQQAIYQAWVESARKNAEIKDNRDKLFGRSS